MSTQKNNEWKFVITPKRSLFELNFLEIWRYRDLLVLFVKRDVITIYKQTILGPLWYLIQPIFTAIVFTIIFNNVANIETGGVPPFLFNLAGITTWNYFRDCLIATSDTFKGNQSIFGKVYFPRIVLPLSIVISNLIKFSIQLLVFIGTYIYFAVYKDLDVSPNNMLFLYPILVAIMGILSLGLGMIISSMVTKYRDLMFLLQFGVQLLMYLSLVAYPLSLIQLKLPQLAWLVEYNPMAHIIEASRYLLLNTGEFSYQWMGYTVIVTIIVFFVGLLIFNRTEKRFIDTV